MKKFLTSRGIEIPKTVNKRKYLELEKKFLEICDEMKVEPHILDLEIWNYYAKKN